MSSTAGQRGVLVESNVLLDVATNDPKWAGWSARALAEASEEARAHSLYQISTLGHTRQSAGWRC